MHRCARAAAAVLAATCGVAACGHPSTDRTAALPAGELTAPISYGTIVALRPVALPAAAAAGRDDVRHQILGMIGSGGSGRSAAAPAHTVEFIIRADDGKTISVVQANGTDFRTGERIALTGSVRIQVARTGPPSAS